MRNSADLEKAAVKDVAEFMAVAARTAPKARGIDNIEIIAIDDEQSKARVFKRMKDDAVNENQPSMERDANSCAASPVILVIGVRSNPAGLNCGFCGHKTCEELEKAKGVCSYNAIDLGIAASSAASIAAQFHVDNRIMYSIGKACMELGFFSESVRHALGIPLSVTGKSPFFDRK